MTITKQYFAYVTLEMIDHFEAELIKRGDKIHSIERYLLPASGGQPLQQYIITAEEGVINSKWEVRQKPGMGLI